jgi:hypothetical protein
MKTSLYGGSVAVSRSREWPSRKGLAMSHVSVLRRAAGTSAIAVALAGVALAMPSSADAATMQATNASASSTSFTLPYAGANALVPTWVFSNTQLCAFNYGQGSTSVQVKAVLGGAPAEYISVPPFQQRCISRWWAGNPVRVTNQTNNGVIVNAN